MALLALLLAEAVLVLDVALEAAVVVVVSFTLAFVEAVGELTTPASAEDAMVLGGWLALLLLLLLAVGVFGIVVEALEDCSDVCDNFGSCFISFCVWTVLEAVVAVGDTCVGAGVMGVVATIDSATFSTGEAEGLTVSAGIS